ncbi:hypothetical protein [Streptomyces sp. NBC_01483]|uniref:hypothetical protein n=1 Tax=Streptomyces sp. NBC_01483 TaxID=2903883 RepID=UPI002E3509A1|nr:hypothetical protein [Streptomyces sp. NBC_01483]
MYSRSMPGMVANTGNTMPDGSCEPFSSSASMANSMPRPSRGFPRSGSPAWYDELTAILRGHGLDLGPEAPQGQALIAEVKLAAVASGKAFTLAPAGWQQPLPDHVTWSPLVGHPLVRRTWAVWPADSRRRDLGRFVAALDRSVSD